MFNGNMINSVSGSADLVDAPPVTYVTDKNGVASSAMRVTGSPVYSTSSPAGRLITPSVWTSSLTRGGTFTMWVKYVEMTYSHSEVFVTFSAVTNYPESRMQPDILKAYNNHEGLYAPIQGEATRTYLATSAMTTFALLAVTVDGPVCASGTTFKVYWLTAPNAHNLLGTTSLPAGTSFCTYPRIKLNSHCWGTTSCSHRLTYEADDMRVYHGALSASELEALYAAGPT